LRGRLRQKKQGRGPAKLGEAVPRGRDGGLDSDTAEDGATFGVPESWYLSKTKMPAAAALSGRIAMNVGSRNRWLASHGVCFARTSCTRRASWIQSVGSLWKLRAWASTEQIRSIAS